jgi:16S rRNA (cytosine1402-N4)-methyltransferase
LSQEVIEKIQAKPHLVWLDGTVGTGGHVAEILRAVSQSGSRAWVVGVDRDREMLKFARQALHDFSLQGHRIDLRCGSYRNLPEIMAQVGVKPHEVDAILLDLGVSSIHLQDAQRGFSFQREGPLDMRFDASAASPTAQSLLRTLSPEELEKILREYGEERWARRIAQVLKKKVKEDHLHTTRDLAEAVTQAIPARFRPQKIHPATKTFQALRMAVNDELGHLRDFLEDFPRLLKKGGRVAIISFHSLEDRLVKEAFRHKANPCICPPRLPVCRCGRKPQVRLITKRPILPSREEVKKNPRARSAKLRVAEIL